MFFCEKGLGVFSLSNTRITMDTYFTPNPAKEFYCENVTSYVGNKVIIIDIYLQQNIQG